MSNNVLGWSLRWVADCELRGVWCGISRTRAASMLASIWGSTGESAVAVMMCGAAEGGPFRCDPQHHIHVHRCHSTLTSTASYWSQHGCSFYSTNTTSHTPEFTVRYPMQATSQGIITD